MFFQSYLRCTHNQAVQFLRTKCYCTMPAPVQKSIYKVVNVAIIGAPNSGKSTLINNIVGRKICAASSKVHTTKKLVRAMCFENDTQIVFLDTPGIVTIPEQKKYKLPESMIENCSKSIRCADVVGVIHDVGNKYTRNWLHRDVLSILNAVNNKPTFLVLNKVDMLKTKRQLLELVNKLSNGTISGKKLQGNENQCNTEGYSNFSDVFIISALHGDGVNDLKKYIMSNAKERSLQYSSDLWTDQTPEVIIEDAVRAKLLDFLAKEIPYKLSTKVEYFEEMEEENKIVCSVNVECPNEKLAKLIQGASGGRLQQIKGFVREDLINIFRKAVSIRLNTIVSEKNEDKI